MSYYRRYGYYNNYHNSCAYCGEDCYYELCRDCYELSKNGDIIKNENGEWVKNVIKNNEYKFYDPSKKYSLKSNVLNPTEQEFYEYVKTHLKKKYTITPQVNLQSLIETDTYTRNDELFRNLDFCIFRTKGYVPILGIELNGKQHYYDEYWKERDRSIHNILNDAGLKLLTLRNEEISLNKNLLAKIYNEIKHINQAYETKSAEYKKGTRVIHKTLGKGTVLEIYTDKGFDSTENPMKIIKIDFDHRGIRKLSLDFVINCNMLEIIN